MLGLDHKITEEAIIPNITNEIMNKPINALNLVRKDILVSSKTSIVGSTNRLFPPPLFAGPARLFEVDRPRCAIADERGATEK